MSNELTNLLETIILEQIGDAQHIALLLSGGVDSLSLGFAATNLGLKVNAYTFQIENSPSQDSKVAQKASDIMGWDFNLIRVPIHNLESDFLKLANQYLCQKKTQFECTFPFLYVIPKIQEKYILSGIAADGHFGLSKKAMMHYRTPKSKFDTFRKDYFSGKNPAGQIQQKQLIEEYKKIQVAPYLDQRIYDFFIQYDWETINKPYQKMFTLKAYPEYFKQVGRRPHGNLQLVARIPHYFERLLDSSLNINNRTRVMDLCHDYRKGTL